jgi:zinc protease
MSLAALGLLLSVAAAPWPDRVLDTSLDNGLRVTIVADASMPVVATQVWYRVGSADEDPGSRGLAHLFEHLMFGRTAARDAREYAAFHTRHGGDENAYTSTDETVYVSEIAPPLHLGVLEREADRMARLVVDQAALDNERRIVTEELRLRIENDPMGRLLTQAQSALLAGHPYGHPVAGTHEDLRAAALPAVREFYARWYGPGNAHVVVVGPVDADATLEAIRRAFGPVPARPEPPRREVPPVHEHRFPEAPTVRGDIPPVEVAILGFPLPPADAPDALAVDIMIEMLTGGGLDPVREEVVVRRGRALEAGTEAMVFRRGGALVLYGASLPYRRKATAFRHLDDGLAVLERGGWLTEAGLRAAKRAMLREEAGRRHYAALLAGALGREAWWRGDATLALSRPARIEAVTLGEVRAAWERRVASARPVRLYVEPSRVPWYVRAFGWLVPLFR